MKKFLIIFCTFSLLTTITVFAYHIDKAEAIQKDGITELPQAVNDSLIQRGKYLTDQMNYSKQDLQAIAVYLNKADTVSTR